MILVWKSEVPADEHENPADESVSRAKQELRTLSRAHAQEGLLEELLAIADDCEAIPIRLSNSRPILVIGAAIQLTVVSATARGTHKTKLRRI